MPHILAFLLSLRTDKITRALIISRKSYWEEWRGTHTGQIQAKQSEGPSPWPQCFIVIAFRSFKSSKVSLCSWKTVFNVVGLFANVDWSLGVSFSDHGETLHPALGYHILPLVMSRTVEKAEHRLTPNPGEKGHKWHAFPVNSGSTETVLSVRSSTDVRMYMAASH